MEYVDELKNFEELYNMFIYKVEINVSDTKAYVITVIKDFRGVFEGRQEDK